MKCFHFFFFFANSRYVEFALFFFSSTLWSVCARCVLIVSLSTYNLRSAPSSSANQLLPLLGVVPKRSLIPSFVRVCLFGLSFFVYFLWLSCHYMLCWYSITRSPHSVCLLFSHFQFGFAACSAVLLGLTKTEIRSKDPWSCINSQCQGITMK